MSLIQLISSFTRSFDLFIHLLLPSFPSFLPSFLSFIPSFLSFLPSFPSFPSFPFLSFLSFLPSFPSFLPSFPSFLSFPPITLFFRNLITFFLPFRLQSIFFFFATFPSYPSFPSCSSVIPFFLYSLVPWLVICFFDCSCMHVFVCQ